jgi:hypothetical protein
MQSDFAHAYRATRRRYELGRLVNALRNATLMAAVAVTFSAIVQGRSALVWLPVMLVALTLAEWRGVFLMKGARRGIVAGVASLLLPLSVLRPCCGVDAKAMGATCCTMASMCWGVGLAVGGAMALLVPKAPAGRRLEAAFGFALGVTAVAISRCSTLFAGEAVGFVGGMAAAVIATSMAGAWIGEKRQRA